MVFSKISSAILFCALTVAPAVLAQEDVTMFCGPIFVGQVQKKVKSYVDATIKCPVGSVFVGDGTPNDLDCSNDGSFLEDGIAIIGEFTRDMDQNTAEIAPIATSRCRRRGGRARTNRSTIRGRCCIATEDADHTMPVEFTCCTKTASSGSKRVKRGSSRTAVASCGKGAFARTLKCDNTNRGKVRFAFGGYTEDRSNDDQFGPPGVFGPNVQVKCRYTHSSLVTSTTTLEVDCCVPK